MNVYTDHADEPDDWYVPTSSRPTHSDALALTLRNGGGTFESGTLLPFSPDHGYAIGLATGTAAILPLDISPARLDAALRAVGGEWITALVGTWIDGESIHVDPVCYTVDREYAIAIGELTAQVAIYDYAAGLAVDL